MTTPVTIATDTWIYSAVPDTSILTTAFVTGRVIDEVTQRPLEGASVRANREAVSTRVTQGGYFAAAGSAARLFPDLATTAYALELTFRADRHRELVVPVPIPIATIFPIAFGDVRLRPLPVRLEGRVVREANRTGIAGATIAIKPPSTALLLRTTAHTDHPAGVNVIPRTLNIGAAFTVAGDVRGGATSLKLAPNVAGLGAGSILRFTTTSEHVVVDTVDGPANRVTLRYPLTHSYPDTAPVREFTVLPGGAPVATARSIDAGDGLVVLTAVVNATAIEISDGVRTEFHEINRVTDADGFYAADGIAGVANLTLRATAAPLQPLDADWTIDYGRPVTALGFRLKP
jgi:hypothetical protein